MNSTKKRKMNDGYEDVDREGLLSRIRELESEVESLRNPKPKSSKKSESKKSGDGRIMDFSKYRRRHIALKFLYLGWDYDGYVVQDNTVNSIEDHLFNALIKGRLIENRTNSNYNRCGRTDLGVSAFSQVISITVRSRLNDEITSDADELPYCKILNSLLPGNIRAMAWSPVCDSFSARFSCKNRTYKYWFPRGDLNIDTMDQAAKQMIGVHDFRNLCKMDVAHGVTNFTREVFDAQVSLFRKHSVSTDSVYDMYHFKITAKGFLWHQIRCIVSILFLVGLGKENVDIVQQLLNVEECPQKPNYALSNPLPLNLYSCEYDEVDWQIDQESFSRVVSVLQAHWTSDAIKTSMIENMIQDCSLYAATIPTNLTTHIFRDNYSRHYKPLLKRPLAPSLQDRVSFYVTKGKLKPDTGTESTAGK